MRYGEYSTSSITTLGPCANNSTASSGLIMCGFKLVWYMHSMASKGILSQRLVGFGTFYRCLRRPSCSLVSFGETIVIQGVPAIRDQPVQRPDQACVSLTHVSTFDLLIRMTGSCVSLLLGTFPISGYLDLYQVRLSSIIACSRVHLQSVPGRRSDCSPSAWLCPHLPTPRPQPAIPSPPRSSARLHRPAGF